MATTRTDYRDPALPVDTRVADLLARMTADSLDASSLDPQTLMLVRIAALVAIDAAPISYLLNLGAAAEVGADAEQISGVLAAARRLIRPAGATPLGSSTRSTSPSRSQRSRSKATIRPRLRPGAAEATP